MSELSESEQQVLAREIAADGHDASGYDYDQVVRLSFCAGWDAAMEYVNAKTVEQSPVTD